MALCQPLPCKATLSTHRFNIYDNTFTVGAENFPPESVHKSN